MNSCILMAEVIQDPQLRYTPDNQMALAEMVVQFPGLRDEEPPSTMKVVGWGNLAQEIQEKYHTGDRVIIEGRLNMNRVDRPEGFKETRAELTVQRIHLLGEGASLSTSSNPVSMNATQTPAAPMAAAPAPQAKPAARKAPTSTPVANPNPSEAPRTPAYAAAKPTPDPVDYDDIPF